VYLSIHRSWIRRIGTGFRKCNLLATRPPSNDEAGVFEDSQMAHDAKARHVELGLQLGERASVAHEQLVEQRASGRVCQCLEDEVIACHSGMIGE